MKRVTTTIAYLLIRTLLAVFSMTEAQSFDPQAISQVSRAIAEWKLMSDQVEETQYEQAVYVTSSLSGIVEKAEPQGIRVISGLAAFDNDYWSDYWVESQIRQWELNRIVDMGNSYTTRLSEIWDVTKILTKTAMKTALGVGLKGTTLGPIWSTVSTVESAYSLGKRTIATYGTSMQIMNPPIYLQNNPKLTRSLRIVGVPISGTWEGSGSYDIPAGVVYYEETLKSSEPGPIAQMHTDRVITNMGTYYRHVEIRTPATSGFERFMVTHWPLGSYFDLTSSTVTTMSISQQGYCIETIGGMSKVTPLPSSGIGTLCSGGTESQWKSPPPTLNATWKTIEIGSTIFRYPSIHWRSVETTWTVLSTNASPTYTLRIPNVPTYAPSMPSSSWGRR